MGLYLRPQTLEEALAALAADATEPSADPLDRLTVLAGATDFYSASTGRQAWFQRTPANVLDITGLSELLGIAPDGYGFRIGALTTWSDLIAAPLPRAFDALKRAARQVGGQQVQNRGTLAGNLCNASPAADGVPPLLALDAVVEVTSAARIPSRLPLSAFILGNRRTALAPGELLTAIRVPSPMPDERSVFLKLGARSYLVISIASVAANLALDPRGRIVRARIAVGACSAVPQRLAALEERLVGERPEAAQRAMEPAMLAALSPIDDIRASAAYRLDAALTLVRRALDHLAEQRSAAA
jgi:CO/xanthine dehydrogenase FAD-binding subunit